MCELLGIIAIFLKSKKKRVAQEQMKNKEKGE